MFRVGSTKIIEIVRGDSFEYPLFINMGTEMYPERYLLKDEDIVYFAVMEPNQRFENAILKKTFKKIYTTFRNFIPFLFDYYF
jgi:hypothetical protein